MGFTIVSITLSLIAVFMPILLMGGIVGRLFREFAITLSLAILVSLVISLTTTPMLCALFLRPNRAARRLSQHRKSFGQRAQEFYGRTLAWTLDHNALMLIILAATVVLNVVLLTDHPERLLPDQDTGRMIGSLQADQSISFQSMSQKLTQMMSIVQHDPAVLSVVGSPGQAAAAAPRRPTPAVCSSALKAEGGPRQPRYEVMTRLRRELSRVPGGRLFLVPAQDIRVGGRQGNAAYQYTLQADNTAEVFEWAPKLLAALQRDRTLTDVNSDQQQAGLETEVTIDRATASRLGLTVSQIDNTLYDAFGQRSVSTIYNALNQYHVVMEVAPQYWQDPADPEPDLDQHLRRHAERHGDHQRCPPAPSPRASSASSTVRVVPHRPTASTTRTQRGAERARRSAASGSASVRAQRRSAPGRRRWSRCPRWRTLASAAPRCRSTIRANSSPPPSRSTWRRAARCPTPPPRSTKAVADIHMPAEHRRWLRGHGAGVPAIA